MAVSAPSPLIFGASSVFNQTLVEVDKYSRSPWPVLLLGETGVGKELIARRIHEQSDRRRHPFVPINCAAFPHHLFESELFGFEKGSFSGAHQNHPGLLRSAHHGTVFLDEVGDLDLSSQVKLLRFLDSGEVRRVGAVRADFVDVRIVAATNVDLSRLVRLKRFRLDLLERLGVLTVRVPPLRERPEDIALIARDVLGKLGCPFNESIIGPLSQYEWPGNVRQLRNVLIRACVLGQFEVGEKLVRRLLLQEESFIDEPSSSLGEVDQWDGPLKEIEKRAILVKLRRNSGNRRRTAKDLGIAKSTLHEKLRQWRLEGHEATETADVDENGSSVVSLDPAPRS